VLTRRLAKVIMDRKPEGLSILLTESDLSHSKEMLDALFVFDRGEEPPRRCDALAATIELRDSER
jgi:branched-chain amino acid transport system ATP-binding protein